MEWNKDEMEIKEVPMEAIEEHWRCPLCSIGELKATGEHWLTNPPGYFHICDFCGIGRVPRKGAKYPRITYKPKEKP